MTKIDELEQLFFKVLNDLEEYLPYLVLVGGWVPYLYAKYLWKNLSMYPVTTTDIDFGIVERSGTPLVSESIYSRFSRLQYKERHLKMDRMFPVVPILENPGKTFRLMIEFITEPGINKDYIESLVGTQIFVNRVDKFDILLSDIIQIQLVNRGTSPYRSCFVNVPPPHIFLFHKALTFVEREDEERLSKDIYYIYYILRFHPDKESLLHNLRTLKFHEDKRKVVTNLRNFFSRVTSKGCIMVERENGPDYYISDVRQDAFRRYNDLIDVLV